MIKAGDLVEGVIHWPVDEISWRIARVRQLEDHEIKIKREQLNIMLLLDIFGVFLWELVTVILNKLGCGLNLKQILYKHYEFKIKIW